MTYKIKTKKIEETFGTNYIMLFKNELDKKCVFSFWILKDDHYLLNKTKRLLRALLLFFDAEDFQKISGKNCDCCFDYENNFTGICNEKDFIDFKIYENSLEDFYRLLTNGFVE